MVSILPVISRFHSIAVWIMKEISAIVNAYSSIDFSCTRAALATVVRVEGSSYRRTGARMLVLDNGQYTGGISGGCLEGDALQKAQKAIIENRPTIVTYDTTQDDNHQIGVGLGCNGVIDILFTPLHPKDALNSVEVLKTVVGTREPKALIMITRHSQHPDWRGKLFLFDDDAQFSRSFPDASAVPELLKAINLSLSHRRSQNVVMETADAVVEVFIEMLDPAIRLMLFGGNYDIFPLMRMAKELGWEVHVQMNILKASKEVYAIADRVWDKKEPSETGIDPFTAVVLMAHDLQTDYTNLLRVAGSAAGYIGLLGPLKRGLKLFTMAEEAGRPIPEHRRPCIFAPAGLDIGANTPEEIALSILAEIKSHFASRPGTSLRLRDRAIHDA